MMPIKKIVVVGAGTSGWMTASLIKKQCPEIDVTVVFNSKIPTMGVGETLTFRMPGFMKTMLGIKDEDWMPRCQATYKSGVRWMNWRYKGEVHQSSYIEDFPANRLLTASAAPKRPASMPMEPSHIHDIDYRLMITDLWRDMYLGGHLTGTVDDQQAALADQYFFALNDKSIRKLDGTWLTDSVIGFSYHYNAEVVSNVIGDLVGRPCGVKEIDCNIRHVQVEQGEIKYLELDNDEKITADLFIDCSGFKRLLMSQVDNEWAASDEYCNNSAIVKQIFYDGKDHPQHRITNSTTFCSMDSGWRFSVPLQNRSGNGYIFNKNITPDVDRLVEEFNRELDHDGDVRLIQWNPGHYKKILSRNCAGFGLSVGFSDPFDANNLSLTIHMLELLVTCLKSPNLTSLDEMAKVMNRISNDYWRDVEMRYKSALRLSPRNDTHYYQTMARANQEQRYLEEFIQYTEDNRRKMQQVPPTEFDTKPVLYASWSYTTLALRYGIPLPVHDVNPDLAEIARHYFNMKIARGRYMAQQAPGLNEFYRTYYQAEV